MKPEASRKETTGRLAGVPARRPALPLPGDRREAEDNAVPGRLARLEGARRPRSGESHVQYAPPGYLLFVRDGTLVAQPFDASALKFTGEPVPVAEQIGTESVGLARFSVSRNGTLVYWTGERGDRFIWVDRSGKEGDAVRRPPATAATPRSRRTMTGSRTTSADPRSGKRDIWIRDLGRGVSSRFTFGEGRRELAAVVARRPACRLLVRRATTSAIRPRHRLGRGEAAFKSDEMKVALGLVARRAIHRVLHARARRRAATSGCCRTFGDKKPVRVPQDAFKELPATSLARRALARVRVERVRARRDLRPDASRVAATSGRSRPRWRDPHWGARRQRDVLPLARPADDGGRDHDGQPCHGRRAAAALPGRFARAVAREHYIPTADGKRFLVVAPLGREAMPPTTVIFNWMRTSGR